MPTCVCLLCYNLVCVDRTSAQLSPPTLATSGIMATMASFGNYGGAEDILGKVRTSGIQSFDNQSFSADGHAHEADGLAPGLSVLHSMCMAGVPRTSLLRHDIRLL